MTPLRAMIAVAILSNLALLGCLALLWTRVRRTEGALLKAQSDPEKAPKKR